MTNRNEIIGHWYFNDLLGHKGQIPNPNAARYFMKNLMNIAGADGTISDKERRWVIGYATACGNPEDVINELRAYQAGPNTNVFQNLLADRDQDYVKLTRRSIIYNAIRAAGADGELHKKEIEAVYEFAKRVDVTPEQVREVQDLYEEEQQMREKRIKILFPQGFETVLNAFDQQK